MAEIVAEPTDNDAVCAALVRELDIDRYYSCLFAPAGKRAALLALYAFNAEIGQVRARVSDPLPGEVRLQWWRDVVANGVSGDEGSGHPVAAALELAIQRHTLPRAAFEALIDARVFDLYDDVMPTLHDLEGYAGETSSALMRLASLILADGIAETAIGPANAAGHGGVAYAITGLLRAFPFHAARGQVFLPSDMMARHGVTREAIVAGREEPGLRPLMAEMRAAARRHLAQGFAHAVPKQVAPAFLPLCLCRGYLEQMDAPGHDPFRSSIDRTPLAKLWVMWRGLPSRSLT